LNPEKKNMARPKKIEAAPVETTFDEPKSAAALQTLQQQGNALINTVAQQLEQTEYSRAAAITTLHGLMANASLVMYEMGRVLCWVRANEPAEEFVELLDHVGVERRLAQKLMKTFRKFSSALNAEQRDRMLGLSRSKLLEMVALDDDELTDVADGESDLGSIDEIGAMSVSELRAKLRQEREQRAVEADAKQKRLDDRARRIDQLENEVEKLQHGTKDEIARAQKAAERHAIEQLQAATLALLTQIESFDVAVADMLAKASSAGADTPALRGHAADTLSYAFRKIADISIEREMPVDFELTANPAWLSSMTATQGA
jgi:hypothetical protein